MKNVGLNLPECIPTLIRSIKEVVCFPDRARFPPSVKLLFLCFFILWVSILEFKCLTVFAIHCLLRTEVQIMAETMESAFLRRNTNDCSAISFDQQGL